VATQNLGPAPTRPTDVVDLGDLTTMYPSLSSTVVTHVNITAPLPPSPIDHTMFFLEVAAPTVQITVTVPVDTLLTTGVQPVTVVPPGKTGFFGFRYSATAGAWFLLSSTTQV
jgi:hypothetical protein